MSHHGYNGDNNENSYGVKYIDNPATERLLDTFKAKYNAEREKNRKLHKERDEARRLAEEWKQFATSERHSLNYWGDGGVKWPPALPWEVE